MSYYDTSYPPSLWAPEPPPVIPVTGVTPGTPGAFTPANATAIPATLAELNSLGALGQTTAWTTGQYVVLGNASNAYWNGTLWVTGVAADEPQAAPESFTAIPVDNPPDE